MHLFRLYAHAQNVRCLFGMHCIMLMLLLLAITLCLAVCYVDSTEIDFVLPTKLSYKVANNLSFFLFPFDFSQCLFKLEFRYQLKVLQLKIRVQQVAQDIRCFGLVLDVFQYRHIAFIVLFKRHCECTMQVHISNLPVEGKIMRGRS